MRGSSDDLAEALATARREAAVMAAGDIEAYLDLLAADAIYLPPNSAPKSGSELRAWLGEFLRTFVVQWLSYEDGATTLSGDLAVHDYAYEWRVTPRAGGQSVLGRGKGIQVLHRVSGGSWKFLRNIWNATPT
jgi:ketosteroid isomerase-like protein